MLQAILLQNQAEYMLGAVSYTHLDVYKRKVYAWGWGQYGKLGNGYTTNRNDTDSVSYTHLDVYKRQVKVQSAKDMYDAVIERADSMDIIVKAAAVADYRPKNCLLYTSRCV